MIEIVVSRQGMEAEEGLVWLQDFPCDAPNLGCPLTTRQPVENLYVSYFETHT